MEQFEQLLTCCVCLDRYRIPKLLPCQHSFCMEPCMEGLVDYVRRQVKCPECRAEHRIPYNGVQAFPTNVTLQRFLELHIEITGELPDPTSGQIMERCSVCSEKSYLSYCAHCEKKICEDCKSAHMDILRREITRFNSQIRRSLHRLQDTLAIIEKNSTSLQTNCVGVTEEIDEICRRITKAIKDRTDQLRSEVDRYLTIEMRNLTTLRENLDHEIQNISSNCDIVDKYMNETVEWDDCELMDTKEIFLKTVEFLRHFEYENTDYTRRVRFLVSIDPNQLVLNLATFGDLNIAPHSQPSGSVSSSHLAPPSGLQPGLMRSKSDHRLATQFRQQEERVGYNDEPVLGGRKFGERPVRANNNDRYGEGNSRYGRGTDYDYENEYDNDQSSSRPGKSSRFRSRFVRSHQNDDSDSEQQQAQRQQELEKKKDRVVSGEDVSRGQLSGIIRLSDCARVIQRLADIGKEKKEKKVDTAAQAAVQAAIQAQKASMQRPKQGAATQRQVSEDDEISRIKRQNKNAPGGATTQTSAANTTAQSTESERPAADRVAALKRTGVSQGTSEESDSSNHASPSKTPVSAQVAAVKKTTRSGSSDSTASTESSTSSAAAAAPSSSRARESPARSRATPAASAANTSSNSTPTAEKKPFVSRFLPQHSSAAASSEKKKAESESSSEEETSSEESEDEVDTKSKSTAATSSSLAAKSPVGSSALSSAGAGSSSGASSYRERLEARRNSRDDASTRTSSSYATPSSSGTSGYGSSTRQRAVPAPHHSHDTEDRYGSGSAASGSSYTSRFLNKSKSSAIVSQPSLSTPTASFDEDANGTGDDSDSRYGTGRSRYLAMKERRSRLARSRSSHALGNEDDDLDEPVSPTTASPSAYLASRYSGYGGTDLARSRSSHALKSRDNSPITDRSTTSGRSAIVTAAGSSTSAAADSKDGEALSSWARYLKNKYGNKSAKDTPSSSSSGASAAPSSSHSHGAGVGSSSGSGSSASRSHASDVSRRLSLGLPLRQANELASSDDDGSKNGLGSPTSPTVAAAAGITGVAGTSLRDLYLRKRQQLFQLGGRGSEPGSFTWPRGVAVGPDNSFVVADSSNHRIQVFDSNGIFVQSFGDFGCREGEFDCLAGVAINRIGQYIVADRYNHRIQVLDPQGRFLRAFGSQGQTDGKFNYPWGIATDSLGFIYVCDKENHRVQVFQSDGTFVGKFGQLGPLEGELEHPHYIAVSNTNRVIVSDSNNHRIQIFDVNGKVLKTIGSEGSDDGQLKFPRGIAVDDQGYIVIADAGNNRIQIYSPDGTFLRAFGSWGSGRSEFKGLEGVGIMSNGNILVCDRENHRIQVF
ncbi:RING finger protein nhl-1 isoform X2 [Zeugodacus cucurbitae]|uniref:RING finger protein nhl-1 isoform X2 n=1 Tax=Zeugodacus cucurbitae TaxID=28588 RepID=UPI0023D93141|nr:RING finger protein nhl-1 isoform X2 [Zeugodacus cucurbitae]